MRRKDHEAIVAQLQRENRRLMDVIERLNDRLMWLAGVPYQAAVPAEPDEPETDVDELPATSIEQYPFDDEE